MAGKVAAIGEVMVELSPAEGGHVSGAHYQLGFAGDTFNTSVGLARLGISTAYVTLLGDDQLSDKILDLMQDESVSPALIERLPDRQPGLYVISNAANGERSFRYWRGESPARELWANAAAAARLEAQLAGYSHLYLSGITLAIMQPDARDRLRRTLIAHRQRGGRVVFDSNFRPRLWRDTGEARKVIGDVLAQTDLALLTLEDEQALWGEKSLDLILHQHRQRGVRELVIKRGPEPVVHCFAGQITEVPVPAVRDILDTTGAGDAFNAGFLAQWLHGNTPVQAVASGNCAAATVIRQRGGIVPRAYFLQAMANG